MKWIVAFGRFWYDFIVGDSAVLAIGGVLVLLVGFILGRTQSGLLPQLVLPVAAIGIVVASLPRSR